MIIALAILTGIAWGWFTWISYHQIKTIRCFRRARRLFYEGAHLARAEALMEYGRRHRQPWKYRRKL